MGRAEWRLHYLKLGWVELPPDEDGPRFQNPITKDVATYMSFKNLDRLMKTPPQYLKGDD